MTRSIVISEKPYDCGDSVLLVGLTVVEQVVYPSVVI
jgi:hypothetical protein